MEKVSLQNHSSGCTIESVLQVIGGKWAIPIIYTLSQGTMRFKEIERALPLINTRMLVKELKSLELNNVIRREAFATVPPTVEYSLSESGEAIVPIIKELYRWGKENLPIAEIA